MFFCVFRLLTIAIFLFQDVVFHLDELIVYILFYSWIKMAEIVQNPFDGHKHYDIDVEKQIDTELYTATAALHF
jgi:ABC-type microcin C transport system permease subunit YejE